MDCRGREEGPFLQDVGLVGRRGEGEVEHEVFGPRMGLQTSGPFMIDDSFSRFL